MRGNSGYTNEVKPGYKKVCCRLGKNAGGVIRVIAILFYGRW